MKANLQDGHKRLVLLLAALVLLAGAASGCSSISVRGAFTPVGVYGQSQDATRSLDSVEDVKVYYKSAPDGFTLTNNEVEVEDGYGHTILGDIKVIYESGFCDQGHIDQATIIRIMQETAHEKGANAVIFANSKLSQNPTRSRVCGVAKQGGTFGWGWAVRLNESTAE